MLREQLAYHNEIVPCCLLIHNEESDKVQKKCIGKSCNKNMKQDQVKVLQESRQFYWQRRIHLNMPKNPP